jgi:hypothetical protein
MTVLSFIPAHGSALLWCLAAIILAVGEAISKPPSGSFLLPVVGSDNVLARGWSVKTPRHDLMIFFGTRWSIARFGVIALSSSDHCRIVRDDLDIYGEVFRIFAGLGSDEESPT